MTPAESRKRGKKKHIKLHFHSWPKGAPRKSTCSNFTTWDKMCLSSLRQERCPYYFRFQTVQTEKGHYHDSSAVRTKVARRRRRNRAFTVATEIQIDTNIRKTFASCCKTRHCHWVALPISLGGSTVADLGVQVAHGSYSRRCRRPGEAGLQRGRPLTA